MAKGRRKKTLRDYTREFPSEEDKARFNNALNEPSPMVVAVVMAIELEYLLEQLLILKLKRKDQETVEMLCKENGALATFFSKICLGYAFGIYGETQMEWLHTVRRIRNAFAHSRKHITFATVQVRDELASVPLPKAKRSASYKAMALVKKMARIELPDDASGRKDLAPRAAYIILCQDISILLRLKLLASLRSRKLQNRPQF